MPIYTENRKARHDYEVLEKFEGGLVLDGSEVKSIREGGAKLAGSFLKVMGGELWLVGATVSTYSKDGRIMERDATRRRKVLVHQKELKRLAGKTDQKGLTLVPFSLYSEGRRLKISFGVCRGRKAADKRERLKERDIIRHLRQES